MPPPGRWRTLPPAFFDPRVSDAQLQELWTKGAEDATERLRERVAALEAELEEARAALADAEAFTADAQEVRERYRGPRGPHEPKRLTG